MAQKTILSSKKILQAVSGIYNTMHIFNLEKGICEEIYAFKEVHELFETLNGTMDLQSLIHTIVEPTTTKEYKKSVLEFTNFSSLQKRIAGKKSLSFDFIGSIHGWVRASFIPVSYDKEGNLKEVIYTTRIIQADRLREEKLLSLIDIDELTGLLNRRAFEREIENLSKEQISKFLTIINFDVNELKTTNDTLGHSAGDELIKGTADCLRKTFDPSGKIFRIGGDEFSVIVDCDLKQLIDYFNLFENYTAGWKGDLAKVLTVSKGHASHAEFPELSVRELNSKADMRMYKEKDDFYKTKGMEFEEVLASADILQQFMQRAYIEVLSIEFSETSRPRLLITEHGRDFFGLDKSFSPEQCYDEWIRRIHPDYKDAVFAGVEKIIIGNQAEMQYPWYHPKAGLLYVRTTGFRDSSFNNGIRINGFIQNISNLVHLQKDELTGFYNKEFFFQKAEEILNAHPEKHYRIFVSDVENFKAINEKYGIETGDRLLKYLARSLKKMAPNLILSGRIEADTFVCLQEGSTQLKQTREEGLSIQKDIMEKSPVPNVSWKHGIYYTESGRDVSVQVMCDRARHAAESIKGDYEISCAVYNDALATKIQTQQQILDNMEDALKKGEFKIFLQPKFDLHKNKTGGAEALIRWIHPKIGFMSPADFIPVFEKNGFVKNLDQFVLMEVCKLLRRWLDENKPVVPISVNLSRRDFEYATLAEQIIEGVDSFNLPHELIHFELTESAFSDNPEHIAHILKTLRQAGFKIELDDFGAGYSSLTTLSEIDFDVLKIDMSIIKKDDPSSSRNVLDLCSYIMKQMKIASVAEGVENETQMKRIRDIGCDYIQGYFYSRPISIEDFEKYLANEHDN